MTERINLETPTKLLHAFRLGRESGKRGRGRKQGRRRVFFIVAIDTSDESLTSNEACVLLSRPSVREAQVSIDAT